MAISPLNVEAANGSNTSQGTNERCWKKVIDFGEAKTQILFAVPMVLTNLFQYSIRLVSLMFAGHLGDVELAASTLANSWATVTGFVFMLGLSGGLETLCGQGFGAQMYKMLGIHLQASCIISFFFSILISILWFYTEPILVFLHQDPEISKATAQYIKFMIPGLFAYGFLQNTMRFFQTQSIVMPLIVSSFVSLCIHIGIVYCLVNKTSLGFKGAPIAASISIWISFLALAAYVVFGDKFNNTWKGFSSEAFRQIVRNSKLALPSAAMISLECWAFEVLVLLAGLMPNPEITTSLTAIWWVQKKPDRAKRAMIVSFKLSILLALIIVLTLALGHDIWVGFFTDNHLIIKKFVEMLRFLVVSLMLDTVQCVLSGVARGCGWQNLGVLANLGAFYLLGMPIVVVLGLKFKLYTKGLWIGLLCGLLSQVCILIFITFYKKWTKIDISENNNTNQTQLSV